MEFAEYILTPKVSGVWCHDLQRKATTSGTLCLTGHNMILYADDTTKGEVWIPYKNIDFVEKRIGIDKGTLVVRCKDLKQIQLTIQGVDEFTNVAYSAEVLSNVADPRLHFPYFYRPKFEFTENGWDLYSIKERINQLNKTTERWRISEVNLKYECCRTYPSEIIVPIDIEDNILVKSAKFRQGGRFPVMSYCHKNDAKILRSSQPLLGPNNRRCKEDEKLVNSMLGPSHKGYILDVRSAQAATQAKTKGGGFETEHHYSRWRRLNKNLKSYYVQQESFVKVVDASNDKSGSMDRWLSKLESSDWMEYMKRALDAACLVSQCVDREGWSVLIHGAEGFDSTLTVTSIAQIILDPDCRTIRGFLCLIDREWIQGGHPFQLRTANGPYSNTKQRGEGPVFSIFLECVYQLLQQFPLSFEFTSKLLLDLRHHSYSSPFGTFLFDNMQDRHWGSLQSKTISLWTYILSPSMFITYINPLYRRQSNVIWPSVAPQSLEFWDEFYIPDLAPSNPILEKVKHLQERRMELEGIKAKISNLTESSLQGSTNNDLNESVLQSTDPELPSTLNVDETAKNSAKGLDVVGNKMDHGLPSVNSIQSEGSAVTFSDNESRSCFYVPLGGNVSAQNFSADNYSVNSQPDLLEDLLSFVDQPSNTISDISQCPPNLPDLDDLAIDSTESSTSSPDAVSPAPT